MRDISALLPLLRLGDAEMRRRRCRFAATRV